MCGSAGDSYRGSARDSARNISREIWCRKYIVGSGLFARLFFFVANMGSSNEVLPIFDGSDFADWKIAVKNALREKALWRIVNKEIGEPQTNKEKEIWRCKLEQATIIIDKALSPNLNRRFVDIDDPIVMQEHPEV